MYLGPIVKITEEGNGVGLYAVDCRGGFSYV